MSYLLVHHHLWPASSKKLTTLFWRPSEPAKSQEQLKREMEALKLQLNALECIERGRKATGDRVLYGSICLRILGAQRLYQYRGDCYQWLDRHPLAIKDYTQHLQYDREDRDVLWARAISMEILITFSSN